MARTDIPLSEFNKDSSLDDPDGTAADAANGHVVAVPAGWPRETLDQVVLRVVNGDASSTDVTLKAGTNPPAYDAVQGDETITVENGTTEFIGPFTSARFLSVDDDTDATGLWLDVSNDTSVTITAFRVPA